MNNYENALKDLAPCGNDCSRCASYKHSKIVLLSKELEEYLVNFENMAEKMKEVIPVFEYYKQFSDILRHFSKGNCPGCRFSNKPNCQCSINQCHKKEEVNFCFECSNYPCEPKTYNKALAEIWMENNNIMKKIGVENFYMDRKEKPRYK